MSALPQRQESETPEDGPQDLRARRIALCQKFMIFRRDGRFEELRPFLTDDCVMDCPAQTPGAVFSGTFHGPDAIIECLRKHFVIFETLELTPIRFVVDGDEVAVLWTMLTRNRGSGPAVRMDGMAHLRFRGDRLCYYTNNADIALLQSMLG